MTAKEIRESYKQFFASKAHTIVPSAPMVIKDDPTLMFTNAGMNQFKDIILGNVPIKHPRVADSQKCLRVSGKHNDLEEVGIDTYHHTMFEMLGNWSFGNYFKKEAIEWAWEYLVDILKLPTDRLYATVFEGSAKENLERDNEAATIWEQFLPADRIINGNRKDNFWEMGDTGPCGPCSEIHIDLRSDAERQQVNGRTLVNESHPQVIEIWNLVFMQYNRKADGSLEGLPAKVIDTGMGFERLCMAVQKKTSNYDTDVFQPIICTLGKMAGVEYKESEQTDIAMRVIADHIRTIAFAITDGQLPSNAKAGYVIRRILRRAVRYGYTYLGQTEAFMYKLLPALIDSMGDAYPELIKQRELIEKVIKEEEESFLRTLETGIKLLDKVITESKAAGKRTVSGVDTFLLYDTYGFPLDLTDLILRENGLEGNKEEFDLEMQKQKERARNAAAIETGDWVTVRNGETKFVGYDLFACDTEILRYRKVKQKNQESFQIVLSNTPFYAESGGQMGDTGWLTDEDGHAIEIINTKKENNLQVHYSRALPKNPTGTLSARINIDDRMASACNHSATHLIHEALRQVLGTHVEQKGSMVSPSVLRFDFSHFAKVTNEEIRKIEQMVNAKIRRNEPIEEFRSLPIAQAKEMGAMALFGEKYGDEVRVVKFGSSVELCGGTHVPATGSIGMVKIVSESSIASGIRRIEALTGSKVEELIYFVQDTLQDIKNLFNNSPNIIQTIKKELESTVELKKQSEEFMKLRVAQVKEMILKNGTSKDGLMIYTLQGEFLGEVVRAAASQLRGELTAKVLFAAATTEGDKPSLTVMLTDEAVQSGLNASLLVRNAAKLIQGGGGGQPFLATAGGKDASKLSQALDTIIQEACTTN